MLSCYFLILLHQGKIQFCIFIDFDSELRVVEPFIVTFELDMLWDFVGFVFCLLHKILWLGSHMLFEMGLLPHSCKSFVLQLV
jgi:hypothetical protein